MYEEPRDFHRLRPEPTRGSLHDVIEKTFGKQVTTRTWDTIRKVVTDIVTPLIALEGAK